MQRIKDKIWREIDEIASKPELSHGDLETLNQLTDALKDLMEVCEMEEREDGGYSGARRHYVRGHYSRDAGMRGYPERRDRMGRYARDGGGDMRHHLEEALATAGAEDREAIERMLEKLR